MKRTYLEEDIRLIQKYFPGATPLTLRTPFDLTTPADRAVLLSDSFRNEADTSWYGDLQWNQ